MVGPLKVATDKHQAKPLNSFMAITEPVQITITKFPSFIIDSPKPNSEFVNQRQ